MTLRKLLEEILDERSHAFADICMYKRHENCRNKEWCYCGCHSEKQYSEVIKKIDQTINFWVR